MPKACGAASPTTSMIAIVTSMTRRDETSSSIRIELVSQENPTQAHQMAASTAKPRSRPSQVRSSAIRVVTCVSAKTKTRSKNSSSGVTAWATPISRGCR